MDKKFIIGQIKKYTKEMLGKEGSGHDWWHAFRVFEMASRIARHEKANLFVVQLAALLHDIADWKFYKGNETIGPKMIRKLLIKYKIPKNIIDNICDIVLTMSFKGAKVKTEMKTIEGKIVQDADYLDALGAIGIGRVFAYGGHKNRPMYDPNKKPVMHRSKKEYFRSKSTTTSINHFYEKLLLLKDRINTNTAKKIARKRHRFMEQFLDRFFREWEGKD